MRFNFLLIALAIAVFSCDSPFSDTADEPEISENPEVTEETTEEEVAEEVKEEPKEEEKEITPDDDPEVKKLLEEATAKKVREEANRKHTANFHYTQAKNLFAGNVQKKIDAKTPIAELDQDSIKSLNAARGQLLNALEYAPKHEKARALLTKINAYLGVPDSKNRDITNRASQRRRARVEQVMAELNHDYNVAVKLLEKQKYDAAIKNFHRLESELEFVPYDIPDNDLSEKIAAKLAQARAEKKDEKRQLIELQNRKAAEDAMFALKRDRQLYRNRINTLFDKAGIHYDAHEYERAMKVCKQVLKSDPDHNGAGKLIALCEKERWRYRNRYIKREKAAQLEKHDIFNEQNFIFNDLYRPIQFPDDFIEVTERRRDKLFSGKEQEVEEWRTRLRGKLKMPMKHELNEMPFEEVIKRLMNIYDVSIIYSTEISKDDIISLPVRNLTFEQVMYLLVEKIEGDDLMWGLKNGAIYIDSRDKFNKIGFITSYDVRDLIYTIQDYEGPELALGDEGEGILITETEGDDDAINGDDLVELIRNSTGSDEAWENFDIQIRNGVIIVNNTGKIHDQVQDLLTTMRQQRALQVNILCRFLTVTDRELNHIGIDFRGLDTPVSGTVLEDFAVTGNTASSGFHFNTNVDPLAPRVGAARGAEPHWNARGRTQYFLGNGYDLFDTVSTNVINTGAAFSYQFLNDFQIEALVRATSMRQNFNGLIAPMLTCFNTQRGNISVLVQESYIRDLSVVANVNSALFDPEIGFVQTGSTLDVRPIISYDRKYITLQILPTNAELLNFRNIPVLSNLSGASVIEAPTIRYQAIRTAVSVPDRGTLLMGGLSTGQDVEDYQGIPLFSKIPILNFLTGATLKSKETVNDYFLVKAIIIDQQEVETETFGQVD